MFMKILVLAAAISKLLTDAAPDLIDAEALWGDFGNWPALIADVEKIAADVPALLPDVQAVIAAATAIIAAKK